MELPWFFQKIKRHSLLTDSNVHTDTFPLKTIILVITSATSKIGSATYCL